MSKLHPRQYQIDAAAVAVKKNTIVNMRTGGGKTIIAVLTIDHYLKCQLSKKILFVAPTRALVAQQATYLRLHCQDPDGTLAVAEICGHETEGWSTQQWIDSIGSSKILVGTPEVVRRAMIDQHIMNPSLFSLVIFDECHNAIKNSPMAAIMRDGILARDENDYDGSSICREQVPSDEISTEEIDEVITSQSWSSPSSSTSGVRILGLTASFVNGSMKNIFQKRRDLEMLLQSSIISPEIPRDLDSIKCFQAVKYPFENLNQFEGTIISIIMRALDLVPDEMMKNKRRWCTRAFAVFEGLGLEGLEKFIQKGISQLVSLEADELSLMADSNCQHKARKMKKSVSSLDRILSSVNIRCNWETPFHKSSVATSIDAQVQKSNKVSPLESLPSNQAPSTRIVQTRDSAPSLPSPKDILECTEEFKRFQLWQDSLPSSLPPADAAHAAHQVSESEYDGASVPPLRSKKLIALFDLLWDLYSTSQHESLLNSVGGISSSSSSSGRKFRGIVFVEQIATTYPLVSLVNSYFHEKIDRAGNEETMSPNDWPMLPITGIGSMQESVRRKNIQAFRSGLVPLLVSTSALEEGIDVPECSFIIRYDAISTTKSHIQGSGRARSTDAKVYYFENDPREECSKSDYLDKIAKDASLNLSTEQLRCGRKQEFDSLTIYGKVTIHDHIVDDWPAVSNESIWKTADGADIAWN